MNSRSDNKPLPYIQWTYRRNEFDLLQEDFFHVRRSGARIKSRAAVQEEQTMTEFLLSEQFSDQRPCSCGRDHGDRLEMDEADVPLRVQLKGGIEMDPLYGRLSAWARSLFVWARETDAQRKDPDAYRVSYYVNLVPMHLAASLTEIRVGDEGGRELARQEAELSLRYLGCVIEALGRLWDVHPTDRLLKDFVRQGHRLMTDFRSYVDLLMRKHPPRPYESS